MSTANEPPAVETPPIPLPPPVLVSAPTEKRPLLGPGELGEVLLVVLTVLMALIPVTNSDFWLHLATGRGLVTGEAKLGTDPFSYTSSPYWVNHSWLFDILLFGGYRLLGGPALIVLKGVVLAGLALLLLSLRQRNRGWAIPVCCTTLAMVAMSPRFLLQAHVLSFAFFGLTFFLVCRRGVLGARFCPYGLWLLPPLIALWVNLDSWFFVGPLTVALFLIGTWMESFSVKRKLSPFAEAEDITGHGEYSPQSSAVLRWRPLLGVFLVCLGACLLNPFHVFALRLPPEIAAFDLISVLRNDDWFRPLLQASWSADFLRREGLTIAGLAYWMLVILGGLSFFLNAARWRWERALVWLAFLGLSGYHTRAIPYFAVVAGPIITLNLQEYLASRGVTDFSRPWFLLGRAATIAGLLVLLVLAWPGWLHGFGQGRSRVGLTVEPEPGLVQLVDNLRDRKQQGQLLHRGFNQAPETAHLLAWLAPELARQETFFDIRLSLYSPGVAEDYLRVRRVFDRMANGQPLGQEEETQLSRVIETHQISHFTLFKTKAQGIGEILGQALKNQGRWLVLQLYGRSLLLGVFNPPLPPQPNSFIDKPWFRGFQETSRPFPGFPKNGPFAGQEYDPAVRAFGSAAVPLPAADPSPAKRPPWWFYYLLGSGPHPLAADDALVHLELFRDISPRWHFEHMVYPLVSFTAATLVAAGPGPGMWSHLPIAHQMERPPLETLEGPIAPLLVAAREGRRACLSNPTNPAAYRHLGHSYTFLRYDTAERRWNLSLPILGRLREVQAAAAFYDALILQPDQEEVHLGLMTLYQRLTFKDLMVKHLGELIRCAQKNGPLPREDEKRFRERLQKMTEEHTAFEVQLRAVQNNFAVASTGKPEMQKAYLAIQSGLIETALDVLQNPTSPEAQKRGNVLRLNLLLRMGRHQDVRRELEEMSEQEFQALYQELGAETMDVLRFLLAGAEGDYARADLLLEGINRNIQADPAPQSRLRLALDPAVRWGMAALPGKPGETPNKPEDIRILQAQALSQIILQGFLQRNPTFWLLWQYVDHLALFQHLSLSFGTLEQQVNFQTVRGILALEAGKPALARQYLDSALLAAGSKEPLWHFGALPAARGYTKLLQQTREKDHE